MVQAQCVSPHRAVWRDTHAPHRLWTSVPISLMDDPQDSEPAQDDVEAASRCGVGSVIVEEREQSVCWACSSFCDGSRPTRALPLADITVSNKPRSVPKSPRSRKSGLQSLPSNHGLPTRNPAVFDENIFFGIP